MDWCKWIWGDRLARREFESGWLQFHDPCLCDLLATPVVAMMTVSVVEYHSRHSSSSYSILLEIHHEKNWGICLPLFLPPSFSLQWSAVQKNTKRFFFFFGWVIVASAYFSDKYIVWLLHNEAPRVLPVECFKCELPAVGGWVGFSMTITVLIHRLESEQLTVRLISLR